MRKVFLLILFTVSIVSESRAQNKEYSDEMNQINDVIMATDGQILTCIEKQNIIICTDNNYTLYTGSAFIMYKSHQIASEFYLNNGKLEGIVKDFYENGHLKSVENYKNGKLEGISKYYYENGHLRLEQNYVNGKLDGVAKSYYENGNLEEVTYYKESKRNGIVKDYDEAGQLQGEANFVDDILEGTAKSYYKNGQILKEINFESGKMNGIARLYYENGNLCVENNLLNGKREGLGKFYDTDGKLRSVIRYSNDKPVETIGRYDQDGNLIEGNEYNKAHLEEERELNKAIIEYWTEKMFQLGVAEKYKQIISANYDDIKLSGVKRTYYENEHLKEESNWTNGKKEGIAKYYYEDGKLRLEVIYNGNVLNEIISEYDAYGNLIGGTKYKKSHDIQFIQKELNHQFYKGYLDK